MALKYDGSIVAEDFLISPKSVSGAIALKVEAAKSIELRILERCRSLSFAVRKW
jgi:hypothetical protein